MELFRDPGEKKGVTKRRNFFNHFNLGVAHPDFFGANFELIPVRQNHPESQRAVRLGEKNSSVQGVLELSACPCIEIEILISIHF